MWLPGNCLVCAVLVRVLFGGELCHIDISEPNFCGNRHYIVEFDTFAVDFRKQWSPFRGRLGECFFLGKFRFIKFKDGNNKRRNSI